ncbi:hypothetical protein AQUCO_08700010v1 [Aquilegia coerulea]|nr:hypothetical protein AQUCO_08700010v1 [Aquilegia coerulea]
MAETECFLHQNLDASEVLVAEFVHNNYRKHQGWSWLAWEYKDLMRPWCLDKGTMKLKCHRQSHISL